MTDTTRSAIRYSFTDRAVLWSPPVFYMLGIFYLSSESHPIPAVTAHVWDKLLHCSEYAGLALLFTRALVAEGLGWPAATIGAMLLTSAYGLTDEWHQSFVPLRSSDIRDWFADTMGAVVGTAIYGAGAALKLSSLFRARR